MSNKTYDTLKDISLCWMPIGVTFLGVVLEALDVPQAGVIMTICVAANTALGGIVKYYKARYDKENANGTN